MEIALVFSSAIASIGALLCAFVLVQNQLEVSRLKLAAQYARRPPRRGKLVLRGYVNGDNSVVFPSGDVEFVNDTQGGVLRFHGAWSSLKAGTVLEVRTRR